MSAAAIYSALPQDRQGKLLVPAGLQR